MSRLATAPNRQNLNLISLVVMNPNLSPFFAILLMFTISGCSTIMNIFGYETPEVRYRTMNIENISLDDISLLFHFEIDNPNRAGVRLEEYHYSLLINETDFLTGSHRKQLEIASRSSGQLSLPLTLSYREIYESVSSVVRADSFSYTLKTEVGVVIPLYGTRVIPVEVQGTLPRLRMPRIAFERFEVGSVSFSGVEVTLVLRVTNPNSLGMMLSDVNMAAVIGGHNLAEIRMDDLSVGSGDEVLLPLTFSMGLGSLASSVMDMLRGNQRFEYDIKGSGFVRLDHPAFRERTRLPFHLIGDYRIGN